MSVALSIITATAIGWFAAYMRERGRYNDVHKALMAAVKRNESCTCRRKSEESRCK